MSMLKTSDLPDWEESDFIIARKYKRRCDRCKAIHDNSHMTTLISGRVHLCKRCSKALLRKSYLRRDISETLEAIK